MTRQPISDPLLQNLETKLQRTVAAGPMELPLAVKDLARAFFTHAVEQSGRIAELERKLAALRTSTPVTM